MGEAGAWTDQELAALAATPKALAEARKLAAAGAVERIERSADGQTWKAECRGTRGTYQITAQRALRSSATNSMCTCPSSQFPCKHALALMLAVNADAALTLTDICLGNAGATALASAFAAFRPTQLSLTTDSVRRAGAEALAASPLLQGVKDLNLSGNALAPAGVAAFTPRGTGLTTFHVRDTGLTAADRRRLKKQLHGPTG